MKVLVINGPNLDILGAQEPKKYGNVTLDQINDRIKKMLSLDREIKHYQRRFKIEIFFFQSNHEGAIVDRIQKALEEKIDGILINTGAYGVYIHTSIAIRDAFLATKIPFIEARLVDPQEEESFRLSSYLKDIALGTVFAAKFEDSCYFGLKILLLNLFEKSLSK